MEIPPLGTSSNEYHTNQDSQAYQSSDRSSRPEHTVCEIPQPNNHYLKPPAFHKPQVVNQSKSDNTNQPPSLKGPNYQNQTQIMKQPAQEPTEQGLQTPPPLQGPYNRSGRVSTNSAQYPQFKKIMHKLRPVNQTPRPDSKTRWTTVTSGGSEINGNRDYPNRFGQMQSSYEPLETACTSQSIPGTTTDTTQNRPQDSCQQAMYYSSNSTTSAVESYAMSTAQQYPQKPKHHNSSNTGQSSYSSSVSHGIASTSPQVHNETGMPSQSNAYGFEAKSSVSSIVSYSQKPSETWDNKMGYMEGHSCPDTSFNYLPTFEHHDLRFNDCDHLGQCGYDQSECRTPAMEEYHTYGSYDPQHAMNCEMANDDHLMVMNPRFLHIGRDLHDPPDYYSTKESKNIYQPIGNRSEDFSTHRRSDAIQKPVSEMYAAWNPAYAPHDTTDSTCPDRWSTSEYACGTPSNHQPQNQVQSSSQFHGHSAAGLQRYNASRADASTNYQARDHLMPQRSPHQFSASRSLVGGKGHQSMLMTSSGGPLPGRSVEWQPEQEHLNASPVIAVPDDGVVLSSIDFNKLVGVISDVLQNNPAAWTTFLNTSGLQNSELAATSSRILNSEEFKSVSSSHCPMEACMASAPGAGLPSENSH